MPFINAGYYVDENGNQAQVSDEMIISELRKIIDEQIGKHRRRIQ